MEKFLTMNKNVSWYDKWCITFRSENLKFRYHFYSYYCTLGVPGKNVNDMNRCSILFGSEDCKLNDIKLDIDSRIHGKIDFDKFCDGLVYTKLTEEETESEKNQDKIIEIKDGVRFYIGNYLVEFTKE